MFFADKTVCLQSDLNMEPLNQNANEQQITENWKKYLLPLHFYLALPMQHK
jgi:hypothetical protein